jgi:hypothetical protein
MRLSIEISRGVLAADIAALVRTGHNPGLDEPTALSR